MHDVVVWVKTDDGSAVPINVMGKRKVALCIDDLTVQCEKDMRLVDGRVVAMHEGVVLPGAMRLSLMREDALLDLEITDARSGSEGPAFKELRRASEERNCAEEICGYGYPQIDSPASVEHGVDHACPSEDLLRVPFYDTVFDSPEKIEDVHETIPRRSKPKKSVEPTSRSLRRPSLEPTRSATPSKKKTVKKNKGSKATLSVEAAFQAGKLDTVATESLSSFLVARGLSGMGSRKALIARIERFGPVIVKQAAFHALVTNREF
eukprot:TRINITY_DN588_c5_g1_i1.p1 TRINITY_DN588_c5_g1~~TRINITY_DN588_c5_g1_i1.p1  ORF type:complete len:283 (+),score=68.54 TRINITY_DN588_c5_g1_i1:60-851(+)